MHTLLGLLLLLGISTNINADTMLGNLKEGASSAASAVGSAAGKAADSVKGTVESTKKDLRDEATPEATRAKLDKMAEMTLEHLFAEQPETRELFEKSEGYAVFDAREASFYVVAGYGRGVAIDLRDESRTYMKMAKSGAGLSFGVGGFDTQIVILFEDSSAFEYFLQRGGDASAKAGTMVGDEKNEFRYQFSNGKAVFVLTKEGWRIAVQLTGSRYWPDDELN